MLCAAPGFSLDLGSAPAPSPRSLFFFIKKRLTWPSSQRVNETSGLQIRSICYRFHPSVRWEQGYPDRSQILDQVRRLWKRYGLHRKTRFNLRVDRVYQDACGRWVVIMATGFKRPSLSFLPDNCFVEPYSLPTGTSSAFRPPTCPSRPSTRRTWTASAASATGTLASTRACCSCSSSTR